jgi:calcineurin-like phosphoesterase family protein
MSDNNPPIDEHPILYFWVFGDLHFRAHELWLPLHTPRMTCMFEDLHTLWQEEGIPAFCVSPGDIVDSGAPANYALARRELAAQLGTIPFYPGIGNHEYHPEDRDDTLHTAEEFSAVWGKPIRYAWTAGRADEVICVMLEQPNPYLPGMRSEYRHVLFPQEALDFLDNTLSEHSHRLAIIFAHCPLRDTVLDRDPALNLDDDSQDPFFFIDNSPEVRAILAKHPNAALYISGHTHSGWGSPQLVFTETPGQHPVTHLNVMSPWYTGRHKGAHFNSDRTKLKYHADTPDVLVTFGIWVYRDKAIIRAREHRERQWLEQWEVPHNAAMEYNK